MSVGRYDVYVTGSKDASPAEQMRIIAAVASLHRLPAASVAEAFEGRHCRVVGNVSGPQADSLIAALASLGAEARSVPAGVPYPDKSRSTPDADQGTAVSGKDGRVTLKSADGHASVVDINEPIEFAEPGPEGRTGVRGADTIRCPIHGLAYNRRQASGCVRCLAPARAQARKLLEPDHPAGAPSVEDHAPRRSLADDPARRAFWGLAVALVLGFIPAALYARASVRSDLLALRARQAEISSAPATRTSLARFDEIDVAVGAVHARGAGKTLLIWVAVAGLVGGAWTRLT